MNLLSIDYGTKRMGLAWCDTTLGVVLPFGVVEQPSVGAKLKELLTIIEKENIDRIVIGYPLGLRGEENANTERVKKFVFELQKVTKVPVDYFDERFTSRAADTMEGSGVSRDERAAMVILDGYLQSKKR